MRSRLQIRYVGHVDERLKREMRPFVRWLRKSYSFDHRLELRLVDAVTLVDDDGEKCHLRWWMTAGRTEQFTAEVAVGSFRRNLNREGPQVAYPTVVAAIGRVLKYYFQATSNSPIRPDFAEAWGDRLLDAYVDEATPPAPFLRANRSRGPVGRGVRRP